MQSSCFAFLLGLTYSGRQGFTADKSRPFGFLRIGPLGSAEDNRRPYGKATLEQDESLSGMAVLVRRGWFYRRSLTVAAGASLYHST